MAAAAYLIEDSVREPQAFYSCPVNSCRTACTNLMLVVQHLVNKHILVQEGESHHALKREQSKGPCEDSPVALDGEGEADLEAPVEIKAGQSSFLCKCDICHKAFSRQSSLKRHVMAIHDRSGRGIQELQTTAACQWCSKIFASKANLKRHVKTAHEQAMDESESDGPIPVRRENQSGSQSAKSVIVEESSPQIPPRAEQAASLSKQGRVFECDICHREYAYKDSLRRHLITAHPSQPKTEPIDEVELYDTVDLPSKVCNLCQISPSVPNSQFCSSCTNVDRALECRICLKVFYKKSSHKQHERDCHNLAPRSERQPDMFECTFCQKEFDMFEDLENHVKADHHNLFECSRCNKTFASHRSLKDHQRKSCSAEPNEEYMQDPPEEQEPAEDDPGLCSACNASPRSSDSPLCSICRDTERSYECRICQKPFTKSNSLKQHETDIHYLAPRSKTEPETFHCTFCLTPFNTHEELIEHVKAHHRDMFECSNCNKTFSAKRSLRDHRRNCNSKEEP